jgi:hypothetical protein
MQLNDILIFGHTHRPYIDIENRVANTGAWTADMLIPKWFEEYGQDKACSGWYKLVPYGIHPKTKEERKHSESNQDKNKDKKDQNENIVSKTAFQVGGVVKQMIEAGSSAVKQDK